MNPFVEFEILTWFFDKYKDEQRQIDFNNQ